MKLRDQINALLKQRAGYITDMETLAAKITDRLFTEDEQKEFDKIKGLIDEADETLSRLQEAERQLAAGARPAPSPLIGITDQGPAFKAFKGQGFTRYCMALANSRGNLMQALEIAKRWDNETPEVTAVLRAAVAAGTTTDPVWAAPLINYQTMTAEFMELLRPETIVGNLTLRPVPFNVKIPRQTAGATANWVGEGLSKPVSKLAFDTVTIPWAKIAVIVVITQELARFSNPSAERLVRDDLIAAIAQFIDQQFVDPAVAAVAALKPASVTNGVTAIPSTGPSVAAVTSDLTAAMLALTTGGVPVRNPVWVMSQQAAMFLATLRTAQDIFAFPGMSINPNQGSGRTLLGIPVVVSGNIAVAGGLSNIILIEQSEVWLADDGQTMIDTSTEAALQLDDAPASPPTPLVSLWQQNMLGIKAERFIYWLKRNPNAVQIITGFPAAAP